MLAAVKSIRHPSLRAALNQMFDSASRTRTQQQKVGGAIKAMDPKTRNPALAYNNLKEAGHPRAAAAARGAGRVARQTSGKALNEEV